jgi:hypothetical protein
VSSTGCSRNISYELKNRKLIRLLQEHQVRTDKQGTQEADPGTSGMNWQTGDSTDCSRNIRYELANREPNKLIQEYQI